MNKHCFATNCAGLAMLANLALLGASSPIRADQAPAPVASAVQVTIDPSVTLAPITGLSFGINTAVWDSHLSDAAVPNLAQQVGFTVMRYPGGSTSDEYHWKTHTLTPHSPNGSPGTLDPATDFDHFAQIARNSLAQPIVIVNYGSNVTRTGGGDPNEAAAWVAYAKQKHYRVKYWEIGNEIYGNGFYGGGWETDLHAPMDGVAPETRKNNPLLGPTAYGKNVAAFVKAMKAQDSTIKIGAVLTAPGNWPARVAPDWNSNVLQQCGHSIDFAIIHIYPQNPGNENDAGLLAAPSNNAATIAGLRPVLQQFCGKQIPVFVTEANSVSSQPGKQSVSQVNALFAADDVLSWLEAGASNVDWWALHNGPDTNANNSPQLFGDANFGDYGVLMNGDKPEPAANTPQRTYYAFKLLHDFAAPGDMLVKVTSSNPLVSVHAVEHQSGGRTYYQFLVINESPTQTYTVEGGGGLLIPLEMFNADSSALTLAPEVVTSMLYAHWKVPPYSITMFREGR